MLTGPTSSTSHLYSETVYYFLNFLGKSFFIFQKARLILQEENLGSAGIIDGF